MFYERLLTKSLGVKLIQNNITWFKIDCRELNLDKRLMYHHLLSKFSTLSIHALINASSFKLEKIQGIPGLYVELQMRNSDNMIVKL